MRIVGSQSVEKLAALDRRQLRRIAEHQQRTFERHQVAARVRRPPSSIRHHDSVLL